MTIPTHNLSNTATTANPPINIAQLTKQTTNQVHWQDLRQLSGVQIGLNIGLSLPFLLLSWWFASLAWYPLALMMSFLFFTAALRQAHDSFHHTLGLNKTGTEIMLFMLSAFMLCSTHAIRHTHLQHHQDPLGNGDVEGNWARLPWYQAILGGGWFYLHIQSNGLYRGNHRNRLLTTIDIFIIIGVILVAIVSQQPVLQYHVLTMLLANWLVGFFAVWSVHHDCDETIFARTERHWLINRLTFNLLYHIEHHLFPAVPANHLPILAQRLDTVNAHITHQRVLTLSKLKTKD